MHPELSKPPLPCMPRPGNTGLGKPPHAGLLTKTVSLFTVCMPLTCHFLHAELGVIPPAGAISEV